MRPEGLRFSGGFGPSVWLILGGGLAVLQAPVFEGLSFDTLAFFEDLVTPAEVDIRRGQVLQALNQLASDGRLKRDPVEKGPIVRRRNI